jgi:hypothetical protein
MRGATAQQAVVMALKKLGVVTRRTPPKPQDIQDGLDALWLFLETMNTEGALVPFYTKYSFTLDTTNRTYTIGPSGDFDMPVPMEILSAQLIDASGAYIPLRVVNGIQYFQNQNPYMDLSVARPTQVIWNPSIPVGTLELNRVADTEYTLALAVKLPWTVENCTSCTAETCGTGEVLTESDYTITIEESAYCNDECELDVIQQMRDWLSTQCGSCDDETFSKEFTYNGLKVTANAALSVRTAPNPVSLSVPKEMEFPVGYLPFIVYGLAEVLMAEYPQDNQATIQTIVNQARLLRRNIKAMNTKPSVSQVDPSLLTNQARSYRGR